MPAGPLCRSLDLLKLLEPEGTRRFQHSVYSGSQFAAENSNCSPLNASKQSSIDSPSDASALVLQSDHELSPGGYQGMGEEVAGGAAT